MLSIMGEKKSVNIFRFAKLQAILFTFPGIVAGILYSFGGAVYDIFTIGLNSGTFLAMTALIGMPLIFWLAGFILGALEAIVFNTIFNRFRIFDLHLD